MRRPRLQVVVSEQALPSVRIEERELEAGGLNQALHFGRIGDAPNHAPD
jgi:hypothetical protein